MNGRATAPSTALAPLLAGLGLAALTSCKQPADGCKTDHDCKGDRVCVAGACTDPSGGAVALAPAASGATVASATPAASAAAPGGAPAPGAHRCPDGMVAIPAGSFEMGSDRPYPKSGKEVGLGTRDSFGWAPKHRVQLSAYCIDKFEVSVRRYKKCVDDGRCSPPGLASGAGNSNWGVAGRENDPMSLVSYEQARDFCRAEGARLPTEAEWEYAARGTDGREYPWGDEPQGKSITCDDSLVAPRGRKLVAGFGEGSRCGKGVHGTWPVGSAPGGASPFGLMDMAGNVMEWVEDAFDAGFYAKSPATDPRNPPTKLGSQTGIVRGGGWSHAGGEADVAPAWTMRTYWREPMPYTIDGAPARDAEIGFRCAANAGG